MAAVCSMFKIPLLLLAVFFAPVFGAEPIVNTTKGQIRGITKTVDGEDVSAFLGVPYAKPPLGKLRFAPPEPAESWESKGVLNTTSIKPACPQRTLSIQKVLGPDFSITETNEDCLFLDLYSPVKLDDTKGDLLPVIVFWHGGGYKLASGSLWDGSLFAVYGKVVVITMNFRIGVLGFLSTGDSVAPGNWGLLDQRLALQWIQENIENFGGDKTKVTIFGHASGAYSVGLHILSPMSRGLFARGVSQGGTLTSPSLFDVNPVARLRRYAPLVKCLDNPDADFSSKEIIECLRKVPAAELMSKNCDLSGGSFYPTIDKKFILDDPVKLLKAGDFPHVDYILGGNSDEGSNIAGKVPNIYNGPGMNESDFNRFVAQAIPLAVNKRTTPDSVKPVLSAVIASKYYPKEPSLSNFRRSYLDLLGDISISKMFETAEEYSKKGKVYVFHFTHKPSTSRFPDFLGPGHNEEIRFIFGITLKSGTEEEKKLSKDWMKTWGDFARTGVPKFNNGSLDWKECRSPDLDYLEVTTNMADGNLKTRWNPGARQFWNKVLPKVAKLAKMTSATAMTTQPTTMMKKQTLNWGMTVDQANTTVVALIAVSCCLFVITVCLLCILYNKRRKSDPSSVDLPRF